MQESTRTTVGAGLVTGTTINQIMVMLCRSLHAGGAGVVHATRKGTLMTEFAGPQLIELKQPAANFMLLAGRKANPWVTLCEFPWMIAGRSDIAWLRPYLPRAADFSDDGTHWRAAYGPRLRKWHMDAAVDPVDQLGRCIDMLRMKPDSRQAVAVLWEPHADLWPHGAPGAHYAGRDDMFKDYPCTNWLHFQIVQGALDLTVVMRSNDLFWGFSGVNVYNFTMLQILAAACLGRPVGVYRHMSSNLHVYERHFAALGAVAEASFVDIYDHMDHEPHFVNRPTQQLGLPVFTQACAAAVTYMESFRQAPLDRDLLEQVRDIQVGDWLRGWMYTMLLHGLLAQPEAAGSPHDLASLLVAIPRADWRAAVAAYVLRHYLEKGWLHRLDAVLIAQRVANSCAGDRGVAGPLLRQITSEFPPRPAKEELADAAQER